MRSKCRVWGCTDPSVARLKYRDSMGDICTESRCPTCAAQLRESDRTTILDETLLVDDHDSPAGYHELTEEERNYIRNLTDGPFSDYAI